MNGSESYRQYLQYHANNHPSETKRAEAQALLGVAGDDGGLDGYFLMGAGTNNKGETVGERLSNGYTASALNRTVNPWWTDSYVNWKKSYTDGDGASSGGSGGGGGGGVSNQYNPADLAYLDDQQSRLERQKGYADTTERDGMTQLNDEYNKSLSSANSSRSRALEDFETKRGDTQRQQGSALRRIDTNAMTLADSLRRRLGMASGANSSAYQIAAPGAVARQAGQQRTGVMEDYGTNWRNLDTSQKRAEDDFKSLLEDLALQKSTRERDFKSSMLSKRNEIDNSLSEVARQRALLRGGGYAQVRSAMSPYANAIDSREAEIQGLFSKYRTPFDVKPVNVQTPDLKQYMVDRTAINAANQQGPSDYSPYYRKPQDEEEKLY